MNESDAQADTLNVTCTEAGFFPFANEDRRFYRCLEVDGQLVRRDFQGGAYDPQRHRWATSALHFGGVYDQLLTESRWRAASSPSAMQCRIDVRIGRPVRA